VVLTSKKNEIIEPARDHVIIGRERHVGHFTLETAALREMDNILRTWA
jgi:hypothetical protein